MAEGCEQLEAFLSRELDEASADRFQQHLRSCAACSEAAEFDQQLRHEFREQSESFEEPSPELRDRVRLLLHPPAAAAVDRRASAPRSRRHVLAVVIAGGLTLALTLSVMWPRQDRINQPPAVETVQQDLDPSTDTGSPSQPAATIKPPTVELADSLLGVPVESDDPNVTIVLIYPASPNLQTTALQSSTTEPSAPTDGRSHPLTEPIAITYHQ